MDTFGRGGFIAYYLDSDYSANPHSDMALPCSTTRPSNCAQWGARRKGSVMPVRYANNGLIYHCSDDGYFCDLADGICTECGWIPKEGVYAEPVGPTVSTHARAI